jgi:GTP-binding protein
MAIPRIAIVGAPNVGKSTLFNRLLGRRRALVGDHPGLTRDILEARVVLGGRPVTLVDTGGLLPPALSSLASAIRDRVLEAARESDLLLFMVDGKRGPGVMEEELATLFRKADRPVLLLVNKVDTLDPDPSAGAEYASLGFQPILPVSAEHALGIAEIHQAASRFLPTTEETPSPEGGIQVAIAGRPNVGKSSLLNAMLKRERALVSDQPGTTRDSVDAHITHDGRRYRLVDTAGMRRSGRVEQGPEALSVGAARRALRAADVTLLLLDGSEGLVAQDMHLLGLVAGGRSTWVRPAVVLLNKADLLRSSGAIEEKMRGIRERLQFARFVPLLPISALEGTNLERILPAVDEVHAEATRTLQTRELNDWLRGAAAGHPHPTRAGSPLAMVFVTQSGTQPPTFTFLMNRPLRPHFSYARYLENSLRDRFGLHSTPVVLRFRHRPGRKRR